MEGQSAGKGFEVHSLPPRSPDGIFFPQGHNIGIYFPGPGRGIGLLLPPCLMALGNESPKEFLFGVLEDLLQAFGFLIIIM